MNQLSFQVLQVRQAGPISHIVKYQADMEVVDGAEPVAVHIVSVFPPDSPVERIEVARQMVQRGVARALEGTGKSARLLVHDFVIHPVDFHAKRIEEFTYHAVRDAIGGVS